MSGKSCLVRGDTQTDRQTDRQTDMMKALAATFSKPKNLKGEFALYKISRILKTVPIIFGLIN